MFAAANIAKKADPVELCSLGRLFVVGGVLFQHKAEITCKSSGDAAAGSRGKLGFSPTFFAPQAGSPPEPSAIEKAMVVVFAWVNITAWFCCSAWERRMGAASRCKKLPERGAFFMLCQDCKPAPTGVGLPAPEQEC